MYSDIATVSPEIAEQYLGMNFTKNRPVRRRSVRSFIDLLDRGEFYEGSPIRFAIQNGQKVLTDGQHRLWAIKEWLSDKPGRTVKLSVTVVETDPGTDYSQIDQGGIRRSVTDALTSVGALDDVEIPRFYVPFFASALKIIRDNFGVWSSSPRPTTADMADLVQQFKKQMNRFLEITAGGDAKALQRTLKGSSLAVALITLKYADPVIAEDFWSQVVLDDGLNRYDPRKRLYRELEKKIGGREGRAELCYVTTALWNMYANGVREVDVLRRPKAMPHIAQTEWPLEVQPELVVID